MLFPIIGHTVSIFHSVKNTNKNKTGYDKNKTKQGKFTKFVTLFL